MQLKSAKISTSVINTALLAIVLLVVIFQIYASLVPTAQAAGDTMGDAAKCSVAGGYYNTSQTACLNGTTPADTAVVSYAAIPLSGIFSSTGIVFVLIMAALIILVVKSFMPKGK